MPKADLGTCSTPPSDALDPGGEHDEHDRRSGTRTTDGTPRTDGPVAVRLRRADRRRAAAGVPGAWATARGAHRVPAARADDAGPGLPHDLAPALNLLRAAFSVPAVGAGGQTEA